MVEVNLWSGLRRLADGAQVVTVEGATVGELSDALTAAHPGLAPYLATGVSWSVDGELAASRATPVRPGAEVFLIQRIKGG
jgi:molybdopterin synthase sulfur carrier subunit